MKTSVKIISLILASLMLLVCFVGCGGNDGDDATSGDTTLPTTSEGTETSEDSETEIDTEIDTGIDTEPDFTETTDLSETTTEDTSMYKELLINGNNIKDYCIVAGYINYSAAKLLSDELAEICGYNLPVVKETDSTKYIELYVDNSLDEGTGNINIFGSTMVGVVSSYSGANLLAEKVISLFQADDDSINVKKGTSFTYSVATYTSGTVSVIGDSLWNPLEYEVGEPIPFLLSARVGNDVVKCPKIKYTIQYDDGTASQTKTVDCTYGEYLLNVTLKKPGFFYVIADACDASGTKISGGKQFNGGAGAGVYDIKTSAEAPADFEQYWRGQLSELLKIEPEVLEFKDLGSEYFSVKIKSVDDSAVYNDGTSHNYTSCLLTIPKNAAKKSLKIQVFFNGYGISQANDWKKYNDTIFLNVLAHSIDVYNSGTYYTNLSNGALKNYGFNSVSSPNKSYFNNMLLRDVQAVRWVTEYYGENGLDLWNGDIEITGGSQGGFQATATSALCDMIGISTTKLNVSIVWMCDLKGANVGRNYNPWHIVYNQNSTAYFDTAFFAPYVTCPVNVTFAGMGDITAPPAALMSLYNNFKTEKSITFVQNGQHGSSGAGNNKYTLKDPAVN